MSYEDIAEFEGTIQDNLWMIYEFVCKRADELNDTNPGAAEEIYKLASDLDSKMSYMKWRM